MLVFYKNFGRDILVLLLFLCPFFSYGQLDSLIKAVEDLPEGEAKIDTWIEIVNILEDTDLGRCLLYCDSILDSSERIGYEEGIYKSAYHRSLVYYNQGKNIDALPYAEAALQYELDKPQKDTSRVIARNNRLGMIYSELELFEQASEQLIAGAEWSEAQGNNYTAAVIYYNLGTVFFDLDNYEKCKQYTSLAIQLLEAGGDYSIHCVLLDALASVIDDEEEAQELRLQAIQYCKENDGAVFIAQVYNNMGTHYQNEKDYKEALGYYRLALNVAREYENAEFITHASANIGDIYTLQGQLDSSLYYNLMALEIAEENGYLYNQQQTYIHLSELYEKRGNYQEAYRYSQLAFEVRDSIYESDVEQQLQVNADQFQLERKEKQITEQKLELVQAKNRSNRMVTYGVIGLSLIIAAYQGYLYRQQKRKQAAELKLSLEQAESLRLRELDKMKTNFFTNISHELRTPLTLILSPIADVMEAISTKPLRDKLSIVQKNGQRLLNLVNEIMDLSKVEAGRLETHLGEVELMSFVKRVFSAFESLAEIRRIQYRLQLNIGETHVTLDREKVEKILHNLLANAIKFTQAEGEVSLKVWQTKNVYIFEVKDNGLGIKLEEQDQIFDRYYQAQNDNQALQGGTGIGLALVKELAQLMDGDIQLKSKLGEGSCFRFSVPLMPIEKTTQTEETSEESGGNNFFVPSYAPINIEGDKPKVLIVEDHPEMGKYLLDILSDHYQCVLATDGTEALKQMRLTAFDCISSDVMMPNMDGFMLREKINENAMWRQIPFLLLTARHLEEDKIKGLQLGIDDYITKPFSTSELHARMHNLISNKLERAAYLITATEPLTIDQDQLMKLEQVVWAHLDDEQFRVEDLAAAVNYSSKQVGRIVKKHTGMSSVQFILEIRLQKARDLLEKRQCASVIEAQYAVGIQSTSYFTRKFTERFGKNPSSFF